MHNKQLQVPKMCTVDFQSKCYLKFHLSPALEVNGNLGQTIPINTC